MNFEFFNPWVLVGLVAAVLAVAAGLRSYAALRPWQRVAHAVLRALAILALLTAVSGVTTVKKTADPANHALFLCFSSKAFEAADKVEKQAEGKLECRMDSWNGGVNESLGEDLASAPVKVPEDGRARVIVIGGEEEYDDAAIAWASRLSRSGVPVDVMTEPPGVDNTPTVNAAVCAGEARAGVPLEFVATVDDHAGTAKSPLTVELRCSGVDDNDTRTTASVTLEPFKGARTVTLTDPSPRAGLRQYVFSTCENPDSPAFYWIMVEVQPPMRVLVVRDAETPVDHLNAALAGHGMKVTTLASAELDSKPPAAAKAMAGRPAWDDFDAVALVNVAAGELGEKRQESLRRFVFGGGALAMIGGPKSFGGGGYYRTDVERALPVYMDPLREPPVYALFVVFDKSWSMGDAVAKDIHKVDLMREVAIAASTPLAPHDQFGLVSFDSQPHVILELRKITDRKLATDTMSTLGAFGTTNFYRALAKSQELLKDVKATYKHVVLCSDGRSSVQNLNYQPLVEGMVKDRITVSTIGVGADCHKELLASVAAWGKGMNYHCATADSIPQVLLEESSRMKEILTVEVPSPVKASGDDPDATLAGIDLAKCPELLGFNRVRAKEGADVLLTVSHKDEPLLVAWNYGAGRAAALATDAGPRWSAPWVEGWNENAARLWAQAVKSVARTVPSCESAIRIEPHEFGRKVVFDAVDAWGSPVTGLRLTAQVYPFPHDEWVAQPHALAEESPGRYAAVLTMIVQPMIVRIVDDAGRRVATRTWTWGGEPQLTDAERMKRAEALAKAGGGRVNPEAKSLFDATPRAATRRSSVEPAMLLAALAFFLLDVVVRRWAAVARFFTRENRGRYPIVRSTLRAVRQ